MMASSGSQIEAGGSGSIGPKQKQGRAKLPTMTSDQRQLITPKSTSKNHSQTINNEQIEDIVIESDEDIDDNDDTNDLGGDGLETDEGGDGGDLETFLSKNIPAMATATKVDQITKKRTYVTKTNKEWTVDLKPLYKQLELMARKALLITCDKSLMPKCIDFCFAQFTGIESQWILDLAARRFRVNCNSWKSRYLKCIKGYILRLEEKEPFLKSVDSHNGLQRYFSQRFSVDMFYTVCGWTYSWIDLEASINEHPEVKVWCAYIFTEICVCIKRHLNWQRAYEAGEQIKKTQWDWEFILRRFDNLYTGADETWEEYKIQQFDWLHNATKANRISLVKDEKPVLQPKDDEFALKHDPGFLATLQYIPKASTQPPLLSKQTTTQTNNKKTSRNRGIDRVGTNVSTPRKRRGDNGNEQRANNSQAKKRRENPPAMMPKNARNGANDDQDDFLMRESRRIDDLLRRRNYTSQQGDNMRMGDEYDDDEEYGNDDFMSVHGNNDDGEADIDEHSFGDDNSTIGS